MRTWVLGLALAVGQAATPAAARPVVSWKVLLDLCRSDDRSAQAMCAGYLAAVADEMVQDKTNCFPDDVTAAALRNAVLWWEQEVGGGEGIPAKIDVYIAFTTFWPCQR